MEYQSGARKKLNHVKNLKSKQSCQTPFKKTTVLYICLFSKQNNGNLIVISLILEWFKCMVQPWTTLKLRIFKTTYIRFKITPSFVQKRRVSVLSQDSRGTQRTNVMWIRSSRVVIERLTANANVATSLVYNSNTYFYVYSEQKQAVGAWLYGRGRIPVETAKEWGGGREGRGGSAIWVFNWAAHCSTTGKPTRSFATERVSLDSV